MTRITLEIEEELDSDGVEMWMSILKALDRMARAQRLAFLKLLESQLEQVKKEAKDD